MIYFEQVLSIICGGTVVTSRIEEEEGGGGDILLMDELQDVYDNSKPKNRTEQKMSACVASQFFT